MSSTQRILSLAVQGISNFFTKGPFCVSFEVTYCCNAHCKHCHLGGPVDNEVRAGADRYAEICRKIKPVIAQVSGGEPLLRKDIEEIIEKLRVPNKGPYIILTTNATLLNKDKYLRLRRAGVDEFSISLDYPDDRHDGFRRVPGLFQKIVDLLEGIQEIKDKGVTLSCVVQKQNFRELIKLAEFARKWNVHMNFSTYTWLRTDNKDEYMLTKEEIPKLKKILNQLKLHKRKFKTVNTSDFVFDKMIEFFETQSIGNCKAGERFFVINPDGTFSPCGLIIKKYNSKKEMQKDFLKNNDCTYCYTSIRGNSEKPAKYLIKDSLRSI
ncbi:MAG: radical SAM protein [Candidatus Aminicenantes bacterium]|nr:radical SAM protein [Candidatus Aminicenantes bacterium]